MIRRSFLALVAGLLITGLAHAEEKKGVTIRWHGQSFFDITTSKGTKIVFDPHLIGDFGDNSGVKADLVLISHLHEDHTQLEAIANAFDRQKANRPKIIYGLKDEKGDGKRVDWNAVDETFKDVHIRSVGVYHDGQNGTQRGKNTVFILEVDGLTIVHLGDLGHELTDKQIKKIGKVDVLMIPIGGVYALNGSEAQKVVAQLKPRQYILPMHYGTKAYKVLLPADEFLEDQDPKFVQYSKTNTLTVTPDFKTPVPVIMMLYWNNEGDKKP